MSATPLVSDGIPLKMAHDTWKFRSPAVGALLTLTVILGKALVCRHAPERIIFFDALLFIPISLLAFNSGLIMGMIAGLVAVAADVVLSSQVAGVQIPVYLSLPWQSTTLITRTLSIETVALIIALLSSRARVEVERAEKQVDQYLSKLLLMKKHTEAVERTAQTQRAQFEQSLLKYTSLVYLLEESAQKIYSNLEVDRLYQALFRVLEECFGATASAIYVKDQRNGSYFMAGASGTDPAVNTVPMMLSHNDPMVRELETTRRAIYWRETEAANDSPVTISGVVLEKGEPVGLIHVYTIDGVIKPDDRLMTIVCNIASIALANARLFSEVQWLAERDPLTGLYNRRAFHDQLDAQTIARTAADSVAKPFSLLMLDVDHFKSFNDTYGHQAGDAVLEWFAKLCEKTAGSQNPVFRYGGEEFIVIMPHGNAESAVRLAERIRSLVENNSFCYEGQGLTITVSCGIAVFPVNSTNPDELLRKADNALYKAKNNGRNTVFVSECVNNHDTTFVPYPGIAAASGRAKGTHGED